MSKKCRLTIALSIIIAVIITAFIGISVTSGKAFNGINKNLTEQQLYNATNTYNVNADCFDSTGKFITETDGNRITNKTQYHIKYDMNVKSGEHVMDKAQITVLTHGLGVGAFAWSNDFTAKTKTNNFAYDADSLINKISEKAGGAYIYWAKIESTYNDFKLYDITDQKGGEYEARDTKIGTNEANKVEYITDISKHIIILFDAYNENGIDNGLTDESNDNVYYAFNYMLSKIIYDVKVLNGGILPKVNLIGHSRGGITNLQYALDHPDLVATMVSLGTPFFGSTTARLAGEKFMGACDGLTDILDAEMYYGYNTRWNDNYDKLYKNINAYAYGSYHTLMALKTAIYNDYSGKLSNGEKFIYSSIISVVNNIALWRFDLFRNAIIANIADALGRLFPESDVVAVAEIIYKEINRDQYPMRNSWYSDILVPLESQLAEDSGSAKYGGGTYKGFKRHKRVFTAFDRDVNYEKVSEAHVPVGHNLEARDKIIVNNVVNFLDLGINNNPAFVTYKNSDNSVALLRYNGLNNVVTVPEKIDGFTVTEIASFAFEEQTQITKIILPDTVKWIGVCAFAGLDKLETVEFESAIKLEEIGAGAFMNCTSLKQFGKSDNYLLLYDTVKSVLPFAFYNTAFNTVSIGGNAKIDAAALACMPNLRSINVSSSNTNSFVYAGNLYSNIDGNIALIQYVTTKTDSNFTVPATVKGLVVDRIEQFAFAGAKNLISVDLNNVTRINSGAFSDCTNLTTVTGSKIGLVNDSAFSGTAFIESDERFIKLGNVLLKYNGTDTVLTESDFPSGIKTISSFAFCENSTLQSVCLPIDIEKIKDFAFISCENLEVVKTFVQELPNKRAFTEPAKNFKLYCRKSAIEDIPADSGWLGNEDILEPISTLVYFEDINEHKTAYYGENFTVPSTTVTGYYNKGWRRVNPDTGEVYGEYLVDMIWVDTAETATYKADLIERNSYTLVFNNGEDDNAQNVEALVISIATGDKYSVTKDMITVNGIEYPFKSEIISGYYFEGGHYTFVDGVEVAVFKGWKFYDTVLNGEYLTDGEWFYSYNNNRIIVEAVWELTEFNVSLDNNYDGRAPEKFSLTYFDTLVLPNYSRTDGRYDLDGWSCEGKLYKPNSELKNVKADMLFTAKWTKLYKLEFESKIHYIHYEYRLVRESEYWALPEYYSTDYKMTYWYAKRENRNYNVNVNYQALRDEYFEAYWEKKENFTDFSGGNGTPSKPYKITKASQMLNIEKVDMSAHYILCNDINLSAYSNWTPIGGRYKEKAFSGVFDGDLYRISNLTRTADIEERNSRIYFGLFGYLTGTVKNVIFTNVNINMGGPAVNNSDTRVFIGIVAASIYGGRVENVHTASGTGKYSVCTNGKSYVGAIAGVANNATITNCRNDIDIISGRYSAAAGGICGYIGGTVISNCTNNGDITTYGTGVGGYASSGGIAGERYTGNTSTVTNCTNNGGLFTKKYGGGLTFHKYTGQEVAREYGTYLD